MKKIIFILSAIVLLASCGSNDPETIKKQIIAKKEQISRIQKSINKLEAKYKELADESAEKFLIPVTVKEIKAETFKSYINVSGNIEAVEDALISPEMGGRVKKIHIGEGEMVSKGQLLVTLNTDATESQLEGAKDGYELAKEMYEKQKSLWEQKIGSEVQYLQAKTNYETAEAQYKALKAQLDMALIKAPFSGVVDNINVKEGELGSPGYPILHVVNLTKLKIVADVSETYLPRIKKGQEIEISIPTYPDMVIHAPIYRTSNIINPANRTFEVEVRLRNKDNKIKPNMVAILKINDLAVPDAIIVPSNIIKKDIQKTEAGDFKEFLFIAEETDSVALAKKVYVVTGNVYNNNAVVTSGLNFGQKVIVEGFNTVSSGTEVKILN